MFIDRTFPGGIVLGKFYDLIKTFNPVLSFRGDLYV